VLSRGIVPAGTRSRAMTATAPASSAMRASSTFVTSMITPPFNICARPTCMPRIDGKFLCSSMRRRSGATSTPCRSKGQLSKAVQDLDRKYRFYEPLKIFRYRYKKQLLHLGANAERHSHSQRLGWQATSKLCIHNLLVRSQEAEPHMNPSHSAIPKELSKSPRMNTCLGATDTGLQKIHGENAHLAKAKTKTKRHLVW
jgi:hypothetical protein